MPLYKLLSNIAKHPFCNCLPNLRKVMHFAIYNKKRLFVINAFRLYLKVDFIIKDILGLKPEL
jgi:hypothetical protein